MKKFCVALALCVLPLLFPPFAHAANQNPWWSVQSIDTMKYSRDTAGQMLHQQSFDTTIEQQVAAIAATGATHVAIGTPYDDEFVPFLQRWVAAARIYGLHVWFRGNFSGWEGWFGYSKISRDQHKELLKNFIINHPDLFRDGDIFTACPECENGGSGDPRQTGDVAGFRRFLIDEYGISHDAFAQIGKNVVTNFNSMNGDVARLVMDKPTTQALGGVVVIDHYVATPDQLAANIQAIADQSGGQVVLGEFGAPIPDINGNMTGAQQQQWIENALNKLSHLPQLIGLNYWTSVGGSTALWSDVGSPHSAVQSVQKYYTPPVFSGTILDAQHHPLENAKVTTAEKESFSDAQGVFHIAHLPDETMVHVAANNYQPQDVAISTSAPIILIPTHLSFLDRLKLFFAAVRKLLTN